MLGCAPARALQVRAVDCPGAGLASRPVRAVHCLRCAPCIRPVRAVHARGFAAGLFPHPGLPAVRAL